MSGEAKFEIGFHIFILLVSVGIVFSYAMSDFQVFYMTLGVIIGAISLIRLVKLLKKPETKK
ncbi:hypothetical protein [Lentibacillus sp. CBA3610]|uniref:hypothetical protein n=1 Tax=Lentibacillus sp. CBA3610 TaxID=2518176 RepID=UPI0015962696|nr:hypothetical protein [Lentibacillus sp. CBA3610]QKY68379.1 hypothetical protein Len3610_00945 [Lentibacillus sp. CBA3610]